MLPCAGSGPSWVYDTGAEPDPRCSLANERTSPAWTRTSLALVVAPALFVGVATALSCLRWAEVELAMRTRTPLPPFSLGLTVALALS